MSRLIISAINITILFSCSLSLLSESVHLSLPFCPSLFIVLGPCHTFSRVLFGILPYRSANILVTAPAQHKLIIHLFCSFEYLSILKTKTNLFIHFLILRLSLSNICCIGLYSGGPIDCVVNVLFVVCPSKHVCFYL